MASVRRTALPLLAAAALLGGPAALPAAADAPPPAPSGSPTAPPVPAPSSSELARTGDATTDGVLLSLGSVLLLGGAACAVLRRHRPGDDG
ncbi:hypothetical protein GCM10009759_16990 [Kitasatospora saccharophila]|uniref:LPXTG-motif cell wall-anchored protein n=1 Tax=Kitasatospora saccharophila TaxID=407973 RepID=A0ABN2WGF9_9ACTN